MTSLNSGKQIPALLQCVIQLAQQNEHKNTLCQTDSSNSKTNQHPSSSLITYVTSSQHFEAAVTAINEIWTQTFPLEKLQVPSWPFLTIIVVSSRRGLSWTTRPLLFLSFLCLLLLYTYVGMYVCVMCQPEQRTMSVDDRKELNFAVGNLTFGEVDFKTLAQIMTSRHIAYEQLLSKSNAVFYDLGSGLISFSFLSNTAPFTYIHICIVWWGSIYTRRYIPYI